MTADEIPQELLDILDTAAGKQHSRQGRVVACLAEILTRYAEMLTIESLPHIQMRHDLTEAETQELIERFREAQRTGKVTILSDDETQGQAR